MKDLRYLPYSKKYFQLILLLALVFLNLAPLGTFPVYAAPGNDAWQNATIINSIPFSDSVNTTTANQELDEPELDIPNTCEGVRLRAGLTTVWYRYTPPVNALVSLDTLGSNQPVINPSTGTPYEYDTYIAVWTGTIDNNPATQTNLIACNDDNDAGYRSQLGFDAVAGTTYYIQVAQYNGELDHTYVAPPYQGGNLHFHVGYGAQVDVTIGPTLMGSYSINSASEKRDNYNVSNGRVKVESTNSVDMVAAIRLQSFTNNTLYSFTETMGMPQGLLSHKYYFPSYNNTWAPLNSQLRFANLNAASTTVRVTIGASHWDYVVAGLTERRETIPVSGGPVIVESLDTSKKIVAAIRLQSFANNTLYSFAETMGMPFEQLSYKYYFPSYNNTWAPLDSQVRFANLDAAATTVRVTIGASQWDYVVAGMTERRETIPVSGGPVIIESLDTNKKIVAAIRLQSFANNTLYSFAETMGVPAGLLSHKYYFPSYNNIWAPLNSQLRFANLNAAATTVRVTIGNVVVWEQSVPGMTERRETFTVSGGPVIVESLDTNKKIVATIRLQSFANDILYSFAETTSIPTEQLSDFYYFPSYNNLWAPLNSQMRIGVP